MFDMYIGHFAFDTPILAKQHQVSANHSCWLQYQKQMVASFLMLLLEIFLEKLLWKQEYKQWWEMVLFFIQLKSLNAEIHKEMTVLFYPMLRDFPKSTAFP
jgi:hypothetical protein